MQIITRKSCTGQVFPSAKYRPMRLVTDAALRRIGKSRHGGHKIANISLNCQRISKRISPMDSAYFSCRSGGWEEFFPNFFCFQNVDALYRPVAAKPLVLEVLCLEVGTSVACAVTAETIFEIVKCMSARGLMGSKSEIFRFFNSGYAHDRNMSFFRRRALTVTGNTLIKPNYSSVRQLRDSLHRATHNMTKKSRRRRALKPLELRSSKN